MLVDGIDAESHQLDAALVEFRLKLGQGAKLGGRHRSEILRVREQQCPAVADPVMEFELAVGRFSLEIRGNTAKLQSHIYLLLFTDEFAGVPASRDADCGPAPPDRAELSPGRPGGERPPR